MSTSEQIADWSAHNEGNKKEGMHKGRPKCFVATVCTLLAPSPSLKMGTSYVTEGGRERRRVISSVRAPRLPGFTRLLKPLSRRRGLTLSAIYYFVCIPSEGVRRTDTLATQIQ